MMSSLLVGFLLVVSTLISCVSAKECSNTVTQSSSHTIRAQLMSSKNETWKEEIVSHYHLTPTDESVWMDMRPRKLLNKKASREDFDWAMLYRTMKGLDGINAQMHVINAKMQGANFLRGVSLHDVHLDPDSIYGIAQQTNLEYLLILDVDQLVWSFRKQAGLPTQGNPYGGWEAPDQELRGHFVG